GAAPRETQTLADTPDCDGRPIWATPPDQERSMTKRKTLMLAALISIAPAGLVMAQSGSMPQDQTPATASSPSATESPSSTSSSPSNDSSSPSASSPKTQHHMASKQAMKECIAKQQQ